MTTILKCGEYRCTKYKSPVENFVDDRSWDEKRAKPEGAKATLRNLRCNFHVGVLKRSKYSNKTVLPLTDADRARVAKEQAKVRAEEQREAEQRAVEREQRDIERHAEQWAWVEQPAGYRLVEDDDRLVQPHEPKWEGKVWYGEEPKDRYDNRWFDLAPTERYYTKPAPGARLYPYAIRVTRGATLSPNEARALAHALMDAAGKAKAEVLNEKRAPEGVRGTHEHQFHYGRCTVDGCSAVRKA
jgi:hypothetical protein